MRSMAFVCFFILSVGLGSELFAQTVPNRASEIIGQRISLPESDGGTVRDLILDDHGRVTHLVIEHEGGLTTVPWPRFASATGPENDDRGVRGYYGEDAQSDRSSWHRALEKAINEVPQ